MGSTRRRLLSAMLVLVMILTMLPATVFAAEGEMTLRASEVAAVAGSTVVVKLDLEDNPGVASLRVKVAFDDVLTLTDVAFNDEMGGQYQMPQTLASPVTLTWFNGMEDFEEEFSNFVTLTFLVSEEAIAGEVAELTITHNPSDIYDITETDIVLNVINGSVTIQECVPGDINGDGVANMKDLTRLFQYLADWDVEVNEPALDTNGDGSVNMKDQTRLFQYFADWDVVLYPIVNKKCEHIMTAVEYKAATCTQPGNIAYWHCEICGKYFTNENGTGEISVEEITSAPLGHKEVSYSAPGCTDGLRCDVCGEITQPAQPMDGDVYTIEYFPAYNDPYLERQSIVIDEQYLSYTEGVGIRDLPRPQVAGYEFKGWYDSLNPDVLIASIGANETGNKQLYPRWEKTIYYVDFDSPDVPVSRISYTVDTGVPLNNPPEQFGLLFVGWSDDNGELFTSIRPGMTGNKRLHANWTSMRNLTTSAAPTKEPLKIIEDAENGRYLFVYKAGEITNVPLNVIDNIGYMPSLNKTYTVTTSYSVGTDMSKEIATMISETTTKSSAITLSKDWNTIVSCVNEEEEIQAKTKEYIDSYGKTQGGNYYVSNSSGGASAVTSGSSGSSSASSKIATDHSVGIHGSYDTQTEAAASCKLSAENTTEVSAGVSLPIKVAQVSAGVKNTTTVGAEVESSRKDAAQSHLDWNDDYYVGTENNYSSSYSYTSNVSNSTNWNQVEGYETSNQTMEESSVKDAIEDVIRKNTTNGVEKALGQTNTEENIVSCGSSKDEEYTTTLRYYNETTKGNTETTLYQYDHPGYYRLVTAGTVEVYAVVGYDVAAESFFVQTYNVLTDNVYPYMDYSATDSSYKNCQNGAIVFEVPHYVNDYVQGRVGRSDGLVMDGEVVREYLGNEEMVIVPSWYSNDNGDTSRTAFPVKAIDANVFAGNTAIKTIILPEDLAEIPEGAFMGCTNLETVIAPGVTKIGKNAFSGCTSLKAFNVDKLVTSLGEGAFTGVEQLTVTAAEASVAMATLASGAKNITLYLGSMSDALDGRALIVPKGTQSVAIYGERKTTVNNATLKSYAAETVLNGITFNTSGATVLELYSGQIELAEVNVNTNAIAMISYENAEIDLRRTSTMATTGTIAVISRNAAYGYANRSITSALNVTGDMLVCDTFSEETDNLVNVSGEIKIITEAEFNSAITTHMVNFDANGGVLDAAQSSMTTTLGQKYGTLPVPSREGYSFNGWYTEKTGGTQITADSVCATTASITLYAQWTVKAYTASWNNGTGYTVRVDRVKSPYAGAAAETLSSGATIYYGDVLGIYYTPTTAYNITGRTDQTITVTGNVVSSDIYTTVAVKQYTVSWSACANCSITVKRTSSPYKGASTGTLSSGAPIYYGDKLSVTYSANTGYSISSNGITGVEAVTRNYTSSDIKATAAANSYTYNIVYQSKNGTSLGSTTATYKYGTTNNITAPVKSGYVTPAAQSVKWDSTSAKTITFKYDPASVSNTAKTGTLDTSNGTAYETYSATFEYQNRKADSVQIRVVWKSTIKAGYYDAYEHNYTLTAGGKSTTARVHDWGTWENTAGSARSTSKTSSWITVPLSTTGATSLTAKVKYWKENLANDEMDSDTFSFTVNIPAY